jgi:hypothetical protein
MKNLFLLSILFIGFTLSSCGDDDPVITDFDYHAHIVSPNSDNKKVGDLMEIEIEFESHTGEIVHNIEVIITNDLDKSIVAYSHVEHVHASENYTHSASIVLDASNNVTEHTDWTLEAKVYGPEGAGLVTETIEFHVHPK